MSQLTRFLSEWLPSDSGQRLIFLSAVGATVFLFLLGVSFLLLAAADPVRRRLVALVDNSGGSGEWKNRLLRFLQPAAAYLQPQDKKERNDVAQKLSYAGFRGESAVPLFYAIKTGLALTMLLAALLGTGFLPKVSTSVLVFLAMLAAFIGMVLPSIVLNSIIERRRKRLRDGFPDALDMLVVCVESGLGLTAAIQRVSDELRYSHPELALELSTVTAEMRVGVDREVALRSLTTRTGLEDVRGLVSLLVQTLRFGTSVAETLRVYSEEFRDKRTQRAEELAAKIGTKLIFPLVFCLFPTFFVVAIGPAVIRIAEVFRTLGETVAK